MQIQNGTVCYAQLSDDLSRFVSEPKLMFSASDFDFVHHITNDERNFVTDGPFMYRSENGDLLMIWSSVGARGYLECVMRSDNGEIDGSFEMVDLLFEEDGGHGMLFKDFDGNLKFSLHHPNRVNEHLELFDIEDVGGSLKRK